MTQSTSEISACRLRPIQITSTPSAASNVATRCTRWSVARSLITEMYTLFKEKLIHPDGYLLLYFYPDWTPVPASVMDSISEGNAWYTQHATFGHDVEIAYLLLEAAKALGKENDAKLFAEHSQYYKNIWNPATQYFQPRNANGTFVKKFDPLLLTYFDKDEEYTNDYVEGCALQWRWALFFDAKGLISLFKDKSYFVSELNQFFTKADPKRGNWNPGSYYWHGNEPDIHTAYLFNTAGRPDLTQKWVRWILENKYGDDYEGLDGDDDAGTLSAWYIFSSLGFYPVAGSEVYQIGAPLFKNAEIKIGDKTLTITADNFSPENQYVQKVRLNGKLLNRWWFKHDEIANGGTLRFEMGEKPIIKQP